MFGYAEGMKEERLIKRYRYRIEGERLRRKPRKLWRDSVKELLSYKSLSIQEAKGVYRAE